MGTRGIHFTRTLFFNFIGYGSKGSCRIYNIIKNNTHFVFYVTNDVIDHCLVGFGTTFINNNQARIHFLLERHDLYRLNELTAKEERVIETLLRNYGGLFADYEFIDETLMAQLTGLSGHELYLVLMSLSQRRILHFIPRRQVPNVRWMQRREDSEHISLPPSVYEDRREQCQLRVNSMLQYAEREDRCRSRLLLEYFGEKDTHDCGHCDVCQQHKKNNRKDSISHEILQLLSDKKAHPIVELRLLPFDSADIDATLARLISEERIKPCDGTIKAV